MDKTKVYLVQTDTTVGFSSSSDEKLSRIKQRPLSQKILQTVDSFKTLNGKTRIPKEFRKKVRNSNRTTFIYSNLNSYRVVDNNNEFHPFISKFGALYSSSANLTSQDFEEKFAKENSDIIVTSKDGFSENMSSGIYKISKRKIKKIR